MEIQFFANGLCNVAINFGIDCADCPFNSDCHDDDYPDDADYQPADAND